MKFDVIVLGAGAVGTALALHLALLGQRVALVDRRGVGLETSYGNAGLIERSTVVPYSFPRSPSRLLSYALNARSDARYDPAYLLRIAPWLARFWWHSAPQRLAKSAEVLLPLISACLSTHEELAIVAGAEHLLVKGGWLELILSDRAREDALQRIASSAAVGVTGRLLDYSLLQEIEPSVSAKVPAAVHWVDPWQTVDPGGLVQAWAGAFRARGGQILTGDAQSLSFAGGSWRVETEGGGVEAPSAVIALGPWSRALTRRLGYRLPLAVKRGYHMHYDLASGAELAHPLLDEEAGYVLSPMSKGVRLATGIEFADPDAPPNEIQLNKAERLAREILPLGKRLESRPWLGRRPCLPDMLPVMGKAPRHQGLWFNFGHAHHGLTLAPVSGKAVAQAIVGVATAFDISAFSPQRFPI